MGFQVNAVGAFRTGLGVDNGSVLRLSVFRPQSRSSTPQKPKSRQTIQRDAADPVSQTLSTQPTPPPPPGFVLAAGVLPGALARRAVRLPGTCRSLATEQQREGRRMPGLRVSTGTTCLWIGYVGDRMIVDSPFNMKYEQRVARADPSLSK